MSDSAIIRDIKAKLDMGAKIPAPIQNSLILAALVELYEANTNLVDALNQHVRDSGAEMRKLLEEQKKVTDNHEGRIKNLEGHDLLSLAYHHPKIAIFVFIILLILWSFRLVILQWLGIPADLGL